MRKTWLLALSLLPWSGLSLCFLCSYQQTTAPVCWRPQAELYDRSLQLVLVCLALSSGLSHFMSEHAKAVFLSITLPLPNQNTRCNQRTGRIQELQAKAEMLYGISTNGEGEAEYYGVCACAHWERRLSRRSQEAERGCGAGLPRLPPRPY